MGVAGVSVQPSQLLPRLFKLLRGHGRFSFNRCVWWSEYRGLRLNFVVAIEKHVEVKTEADGSSYGSLSESSEHRFRIISSSTLTATRQIVLFRSAFPSQFFPCQIKPENHQIEILDWSPLLCEFSTPTALILILISCYISSWVSETRLEQQSS